jgi:hypothetical protein
MLGFARHQIFWKHRHLRLLSFFLLFQTWSTRDPIVLSAGTWCHYSLAQPQHHWKRESRRGLIREAMRRYQCLEPSASSTPAILAASSTERWCSNTKLCYYRYRSIEVLLDLVTTHSVSVPIFNVLQSNQLEHKIYVLLHLKKCYCSVTQLLIYCWNIYVVLQWLLFVTQFLGSSNIFTLW